MAGYWTFISGGARSGKSQFAVEKAKKNSVQSEVVYFACGLPVDEEMKERIAKHQASRPSHWRTVEEPLRVAAALKILGDEKKLILWDCVTFYLNNLLYEWEKRESSGKNNNYGLSHLEEDILREIGGIIGLKSKMKADLLIVSNEVGMGFVPETPTLRFFRDIAGRVNQLLAQSADEAYFLMAGLPIRLK